ncbi:cytochrome b N-terminal domain-containing protein [Zhaonella formicivorans]|jgi:quinol-cytochrome oxidoreductase complex cytochrome b subunit|uniref:cytochrome b N-terminal domain-containing protein n=1 Tax=Zhaonella formicivorans TaxID=2528593 RepID=UPI0010DAD510|nr:cytochrome b N-terminal domain-containing protein [Zhaonella formicivorans]
MKTDKHKTRKRGFFSFLAHLHPRKIKAGTIGFSPTFCLGGLSAFMFLVLVASGTLLLFYYTPGEAALQYGSIITIDQVIAYGWLIRGIHKWAGQLMVVLVFGHMLRVFMHGAYRPPREGNWVIGVALLILTVLLDFTGYLLLGDQTAVLAQNVVGGILNRFPLAGDMLNAIVFGGEPGGSTAGIRIYIWHCIVLPAVLLLLMLWHFYRVRKDGGVSQGTVL